MLLDLTLDFLIYSLSFLFFHFIQKREFFLDNKYEFYYLAFMVSWITASLLSRKFINKPSQYYTNKLYHYFISFFLMLGMLIVLIIKFRLLDISRFVIISSLLSSFAFELIYITIHNNSSLDFKKIKLVVRGKSYAFEFFLYAMFMLYVFFNQLGHSYFEYKYALLLISLYFSWFVSALFGHHFKPNQLKQNYANFFWEYFRSYIILLSLNIFITFTLNLNYSELHIIFYSTLGYIIISFLSVTSYFFMMKPDMSLDYRIKYIRANELIESEKCDPIFTNGQYRLIKSSENSITFSEKLGNIYLQKFPEIFEFLKSSIDLNTIDISYSIVLRSRDVYNVEILPDESLEFFFNLHETNDIKRLNNYFIEVNKKLSKGGIFAGKFQTIILRRKKFIKRYPYFLGQFLYLGDFIWHRIFPKIPILQKFYFLLTKGYNRAISFAEGLGRLYYCGFEIVNMKEIDNYIYFAAKKAKEPSTEPNPSYGPLFKMKRTGMNGKWIYVYKLRTMHPYAEYLQKLVFESYNLQEGGKFNNDFRITSWGKVFRKLWIDELPMIINFFKGELKLVGVRPLSSHYLSLYSDCLRERRRKYKPGLVPPYYVDMPKTLDEIMQSEIKYMNAYDKHPRITDIKYFIKAANNIIIKRARSK